MKISHKADLSQKLWLNSLCLVNFPGVCVVSGARKWAPITCVNSHYKQCWPMKSKPHLGCCYNFWDAFKRKQKMQTTLQMKHFNSAATQWILKNKIHNSRNFELLKKIYVFWMQNRVCSLWAHYKNQIMVTITENSFVISSFSLVDNGRSGQVDLIQGRICTR